MVDTSKYTLVEDADFFVPKCGEYTVAWSKHLALLNERDALQAQLAEARKAHEKEVYVWSENYAAMERRLVASEQAAATARADVDDILQDLDRAAGEGEVLARAAAQLIRSIMVPAPAPTPTPVCNCGETSPERQADCPLKGCGLDSAPTPSPEAVARAALEWAANGIREHTDIGRKKMSEALSQLEYNQWGAIVTHLDVEYDRIRAAANDPTTIAAIVAKAGGREDE
jgi:hypothetical protein